MTALYLFVDLSFLERSRFLHGLSFIRLSWEPMVARPTITSVHMRLMDAIGLKAQMFYPRGDEDSRTESV